MSNYCVLDINKIKSRALLQTVYNHNKRISHPINAAEEIADKNEEWLIPGASDLADALDQKIASLPYYKDHKLYKNAVLAYELVMTYTPDAAGTFDEEAWKKENLKWLQETFDRNKDKYGTNIISIDYHYDEGSATVAGKTHCHAVVLPVDDRGHFNASYYTGSPIRMRALQDSYAEHMKQFGLERGRAYEASPHERVKMFYSRLNAESARPIPTAQKNESVHQYEERVARFIELERMANLKSLADKDKEIREIKSAYRTDEQRDRVIYKQQRDLTAYRKEREGMEHEFGGMHVMIDNAREMKALKEAYEEYPNRDKANLVKSGADELIAWQKDREKEQKRKNKKEEIELDER